MGLSGYFIPKFINMARHTGRKPNANCSKKQNRTNPSAQSKQGKGKNMPNAGKKSKTVGHTKKSHCNENKMVQHTGENHNNASHTENNQINANHTGRKKPIDASSNENRTKTMTRQEKRRCTENKNEPCTSTSKMSIKMS